MDIAKVSEEICKKTLSDYGIDDRKLSINDSSSRLLLAKGQVSLRIATLVSDNAKELDDKIEEIQDFQWLCILLERHINKMYFLLS